MATFEIDFFELSFLAEACIPPTPIARSCFWDKMIDVYYHQLSQDQRDRLLEWIMRNGRFDLAKDECRLFYARYNKENQRVVIANDGKEYCVFSFDGRYYTHINRFIPEENIVSIK